MDQQNETKTVVELKDMTDSQKLTKLVELQNEALIHLRSISKKTSTIETIMIVVITLAVLSAIIGACSSLLHY